MRVSHVNNDDNTKTVVYGIELCIKNALQYFWDHIHIICINLNAQRPMDSSVVSEGFRTFWILNTSNFSILNNKCDTKFIPLHFNTDT